MALAPEVIKTIRRSCSRIERQLRQQHPQAAALARGPEEKDLQERRKITGACHANHITAADIDRWQAAVETLTGEARRSYDDLVCLKDIRRSLQRNRGWRDEFDEPTACQWEFDTIWPRGYDRPTSPELDRLRALNHQAVERFHAHYREWGRGILADLDSGVRWQRELKRRAELEEYFRNGPVMHGIRPTTNGTSNS
jgi:hypothetical protein